MSRDPSAPDPGPHDRARKFDFTDPHLQRE